MLYAGLIGDLQDKAEKAFFDLETVTKNINNASTPSYKTERSFSFDNALNQVQKNMEAGKLMITNNPNDVSLEGKGFFVLNDSEGKTVLLRNLTLSQDKEGNLVSGDYIVCPKTQIPKGLAGYKVQTDGEILGQKNDGTTIPLTKLNIWNYPAAEKLEFDGFVYRPTKEAGEPLNVCLGLLNQTKVRQKTQEGSNVYIPLEFSKFTEARDRITTISRINQLLSTSEKEYIRTLSGLI